MKKTCRNIYLLLLKTSVWKEVRHFSVQCILTETTWLPTLLNGAADQIHTYKGRELCSLPCTITLGYKKEVIDILWPRYFGWKNRLEYKIQYQAIQLKKRKGYLSYKIYGYVSQVALRPTHTLKHLYLVGIFYLVLLVVKTEIAKIWDHEIQLQILFHKLALLYNFTRLYTNIPSCRRDESKTSFISNKWTHIPEYVGICIDKPTYERYYVQPRGNHVLKGTSIKGKKMLPIFFPLKAWN